MIRVQLFDGTALEFPDGTSDEVINATAKRETLKLRSETAPPPAPVEPEPKSKLEGFIDRSHDAMVDAAPGFIDPLLEGQREVLKGLAGGTPTAGGLMAEGIGGNVQAVASSEWTPEMEAWLRSRGREDEIEEMKRRANARHEALKVPRAFGEVAEAAGHDLKEWGEGLVSPGPVSDIRDIDWSPTKAAQWAGRGLGEQIPIMGGIMAAGAVAGPVGAGGAGMALETGSIMEDMRETFGEVDHQTALAGGVIAGSLEAIAPLQVLNRAGAGKMASELRKALVKRSINALKTAGTEGLTEFLQTGVETATHDWMAINRGELEKMKMGTAEGRSETLWEALNAAALGALVGGGTGMVGPTGGTETQTDSDTEGEATGGDQAPVPGRGEGSTTSPPPSGVPSVADVAPVDSTSQETDFEPGSFEWHLEQKRKFDELPAQWSDELKAAVVAGELSGAEAKREYGRVLMEQHAAASQRSAAADSADQTSQIPSQEMDTEPSQGEPSPAPQVERRDAQGGSPVGPPADVVPMESLPEEWDHEIRRMVAAGLMSREQAELQLKLKDNRVGEKGVAEHPISSQLPADDADNIADTSQRRIEESSQSSPVERLELRVNEISPDLAAVYRQSAEPRRAGIESLMAEVDAAYLRGDQQQAEDLDARLEVELERLESVLEERMTEEAVTEKTGQAGTPELTGESTATDLEPLLANSYAQWKRGEFSQGMSTDDTIANFANNIRGNLENAGAATGENMTEFQARLAATPDEELLEVARDAWQAKKDTRDRLSAAREKLQLNVTDQTPEQAKAVAQAQRLAEADGEALGADVTENDRGQYVKQRLKQHLKTLLPEETGSAVTPVGPMGVGAIQGGHPAIRQAQKKPSHPAWGGTAKKKGPRFETRSPEVRPTRSDLKAELERSFPGAKVETRPYGAEVFQEGLEPVRVVNVASVKPNEEALAEHELSMPEFQRLVRDGSIEVGGSYSQIKGREIIKLVNPSSTTVPHEAFHWAFRNLLSKADQDLLMKKYGSEEKAAEAFAENSLEERSIWTKIREWARAMAESMGLTERSAETVEREVRTGKAAKKTGAKVSGRPASQRVPRKQAPGVRSASPAASDTNVMPSKSVFNTSPKLSLKKVSQKVTFRENAPAEVRTYEVSIQNEVLAQKKDGKTEVKIRDLDHARELNANPERVADWKKIYARAKKLTQWGKVKKVNKEGKLKGIPVVSLTKGCQRTMASIERVVNGILPNETRIEACYGGTCWVNRQFIRFYKSFENMEVRDLVLAVPEAIDAWVKKKAAQDFLNSGSFIRQGQQGDDSHLFATGLAKAWLDAMAKYKIKNKTVFISAAYAPVTDEQYAELAEHKDRFELHISLSGWFHKNEILLRLAEFKAARDAGLPVKIRIITNRDGVAGVEMVNEDFLLKEMEKLGVKQDEVLETPYHDDAIKTKGAQKRSNPTEAFESICCETGACRSCGEKCMTKPRGTKGSVNAKLQLKVLEVDGTKGEMTSRKKAQKTESLEEVAERLQIKDTRSPDEVMDEHEETELDGQVVKDRLNAFWGARDDAFQQAENKAAAVQERITKIAKDVWPRVEKAMGITGKKPPWARGSRFKLAMELDRAIQVAVDLRREPLDKDLYYEDLTAEQKRIVDMAEAVESIPDLREIADLVEWSANKAGEAAKQAGVITSVLDHYVFRKWKAKTKKGLAGALGGQAKFQTKSKHRLHRKFDTVIEGWADGHELAIETASANLEALEKEIALTIESKRLQDDLMKLKVDPVAEGRSATWLSTRQWADVDVPPLKLFGLFEKSWHIGHDRTQYKEIKEGNFNVWRPTGKVIAGDELELELRSRNLKAGDVEYVVRKTGGDRAVNGGVHTSAKAAQEFIDGREDAADLEIYERAEIWERQQVFAPAQLADAFNRAFGRSKLYSIPGVKTITKFNALIKKLMLATGFFHHQAYMRSYLFGVNGKKLSEMEIRKAYREGLKALREYGPEVQLLIKNGLTSGRTQEWEDTASLASGRLEKALKRNGATAKVTEKLLALQERSTGFLFKKLGNGLKVQGALIEMRHIRKKHPELSPDEAARQAAQLLNADFGGLHLERMYRSPTVQHIYRLAALAPDWTESNIQTMINMVRKGGPHERALYAQFWAGVLGRAVTLTLLANIALALGDDDDAWEKFEKAWGKDGEWKKLHWLQVDVTRLRDAVYKLFGWDHDGARKYFSVMGHFGDPVKFVLRTSQSFHHKGSVVYSMAQEFITGKDWKGHGFTTISEMLGVDDKGYTVGGEKKGGKSKGKLTKRGGQQKPVSIDPVSILSGESNLPSYLSSNALGALPIPVQATLGWVLGQADGWDTMMTMVGAHAHSTYKPEAEERMEEVAELRNEETYLKAFGELGELAEFRKDHVKELQLKRDQERAAKEIRKLKRLITKAEKRDDKAEIKRLEDRIKEQERRFSERWKAVMK